MCSLELETAVRASGWGVKGRSEVDARTEWVKYTLNL
jgi:hypothetical protein